MAPKQEKEFSWGKIMLLLVAFLFYTAVLVSETSACTSESVLETQPPSDFVSTSQPT